MINYHYFCEVCDSLITLTQDKLHLHCDACNTSSSVSEARSSGRFFCILNTKEQLRSIIARHKHSLYENLLKLKQADSVCHFVTDITSGMVWRSLKGRGVLRWTDLTVTLNTDGSPLHKSSKASIWPIQLILNELPLTCRYDSTVLAGLWFGRKHPDMLLFLGKFVDAMNSIGELIWQHNSACVPSKVYTICACLDAPARAVVGNHVQFNGFFGCPWCLSCGTT